MGHVLYTMLCLEAVYAYMRALLERKAQENIIVNWINIYNMRKITR